jgi:hypothetical protein
MSHQDSDSNSITFVEDIESQFINETDDILKQQQQDVDNGDNESGDSDSVTYSSMPSLCSFDYDDTSDEEDSDDYGSVPSLIYPSDDDDVWGEDDDDDDDDVGDGGGWFPHQFHHVILDIGGIDFRDDYYVRTTPSRRNEHDMTTLQQEQQQYETFEQRMHYLMQIEARLEYYNRIMTRNIWNYFRPPPLLRHGDYYLHVRRPMEGDDYMHVPLNPPATTSFFSNSKDGAGSSRRGRSQQSRSILVYPMDNGGILPPQQTHDSDDTPIEEEKECCSGNDDDG